MRLRGRREPSHLREMTPIQFPACFPIVCLSLGVPLASLFASPAITVYNGDFGVVRDTFSMELSAGLNQVRYSGVTAALEPESVVLRDPSGRVAMNVLEQSYRGDPLDEPRLMELFEGQKISFLKQAGETESIVEGRILRAPRPNPIRGTAVKTNYHNGYLDPIIEVDGALTTVLPGIPLFPGLGDDSVLLPTLEWKLYSSEAAALDAQLSYITGGLSWKADYNLVLPESGDDLILTGRVSIENTTGKTFEEAGIKLIAGEVNKVQPDHSSPRQRLARTESWDNFATKVEAEKFDEFHVYRLPGSATLRDRETKQVEFIRSERVTTKRYYIYEGAQLAYGWRFHGSPSVNQAYGTVSNKDVAIYREFVNKEANGLGQALPAGRLRFYRADKDGQLEFTGENTIDHTPKDETVRVYLGNAFDLVGERSQTAFFKHPSMDLIRESFEVKIRNRSEEAIVVTVVEPLYRSANWEVESARDFEQKDARTIEFHVPVDPGKQETVKYTVKYTW